jgi:hypothetical protein
VAAALFVIVKGPDHRVFLHPDEKAIRAGLFLCPLGPLEFMPAAGAFPSTPV